MEDHQPGPVFVYPLHGLQQLVQYCVPTQQKCTSVALQDQVWPLMFDAAV